MTADESFGAAQTLEKRGYPLNFTHESIWTSDIIPSFREALNLHIKAATLGLSRRELSRKETPPTQAEIDEHQRLSKLLEEVEASPLWEHGYDGGYLREPQVRVEVVYDETPEEFETRVNEAYALFMKDPSRIFDGFSITTPPRQSVPATFRGKESQ